MSGVSQQKQIDKYSRLSPEAQHLLQLCALNYDGINRTNMVALSQHVGWRGDNGKQLDYKQVRGQIESMVQSGLLVRGAGATLTIHRQLMDFVVQEAIRSGEFERFASKIQAMKPRGEYYRYYYGHDKDRFQRDLHIAFYRSDVNELRSLTNNMSVTFVGDDDCLGVLTPFDVEIFTRLDPILQQQYLIEALQVALLTGDCSPAIQVGLDQFRAGQTKLEPELLARVIDATVASGDLAGLKALTKQTGGENPEIEGCAAFLRGKWDEAEAKFVEAVKQLRRKTRKRNVAIKYLPAIFHLVLLLRKNSPDARKQADTMLRRIESDWPPSFRSLGWTITHALKFQANPAAGHELFYRGWFDQTPPLCSLVAGYCWRWLQPEADSPLKMTAIENPLSNYESLGYNWFAAELTGLLGHLLDKNAKMAADKSCQMHGELKTVTAFGLIAPESAWERSLTALKQLADPGGKPEGDDDPVGRGV